jgi:hypothetical protein
MRHLAVLALLVTLPVSTAAAQTQDRAPVGLPSSSRMTHDRGESWSYFKPGLNLASYRQIIVEPTRVYDGPDAQFNDVDRGDRQRYANIVTSRLRTELAGRIATRAGPGTARLRLTLLGMDDTEGGFATATRVTPLGIVSNAVRSVAGREGRLTGSMLFALELFDSRSGELLAAVVRRRAPDALDIPATISTTETVEAIARELAQDVRQRLDRGTRR